MTYKEYTAECEKQGTTPLSMNDWRVERMHAAKADPAPDFTPADPIAPGPITTGTQNPTGPDPEDMVTMPSSKLDAMLAKLDDLEHRMSAMSTPRDPSTTVEAARAVLPPPPEPWGANGSYSYGSDTSELELTVEAGHTKMSNGRLVNIPDKSIKFSGGSFTTTDPELRDWLEAQPEFNGVGGAKYPARVWRTELLQPGRAVHITDGPKTNKAVPQARYADRPSPLHAKV